MPAVGAPSYDGRLSAAAARRKASSGIIPAVVKGEAPYLSQARRVQTMAEFIVAYDRPAERETKP
jgi:hypothetical protein